MSQDWYLLKSPHCQVSGYEDEALNDFCEEGFLEVLQSELASDVELCNYDLSECKKMRAIIQNNLQDTKLKTLSRQMLAPIGSCKAGMYVKYKDRYWLIVGLVDNNSMYEKAVLTLCNYQLTWLDDSGSVIQRWVNITSASQYNNGESGTNNYKVRTDQLMILAPDDDNCLLLDSGKRFIIDKRCKVYEKNIAEDVTKDTGKSVAVYRLTRTDSVFYDYQDSGHYEFMATQDEQRETDGYYVIDNHGYWLCDEPIIANKNDISSCAIECESPMIYNGLDAVEFKAKFYNGEGAETTALPKWDVRCDFADQLEISYIENSIVISVDNSKLVNKSFELVLSADGYEPASITVAIRAFF